MAQQPAGFEPEGFVPDGFEPDPPQGGGMNFAVVNGQRVPVDDSPLDFVAGAASNLNPVPGITAIGKAAMSGAKVFGGLGGGDLKAIREGTGELGQQAHELLAAQNHVKAGADEAWAKGDYKTALRKYADWLVPILGPALDASADKMGGNQPWRGAGEAVGLGLGLAAPKALENARIKVPAVASTRNPVEAAAVQFGEQRGIPIDAATATGNSVVRNVQRGVANTPVGYAPARRMQVAQEAALQRVGGELADAVYPESVTPEQAGEGMRGSLNFQVRKFHGKATDAYDRLRRYEADPEHAEMVPSPEQQAQQMAVNQEAARTAGRTPTPDEWAELRRMRAELDAMPYQEGGTIRNANKNETLDDPNRDMRSSTYVQARGGAPVYRDILQAAPGTSAMTRGAVQTALDQAILSGRFTNAAKGALDVAKQRLAGSLRVSSPKLPPSAGAVETPMVSMLLPADVRAAKVALRPIYDRLMRRLPVTQQRSSPGLKAIENIVNGPDYAPVSELDADLGTIKGIARGADLPELRDVSQGLAAKAVAELDRAVRAAAAKAGPDALAALEEGRAATRMKYAVSDVLRTLRDEPVQTFGQAVYAKDAGISRLREVARFAPAEMPRIGRAYIEDLLAKATSEGGFAKAQTVQSAWEKLGPETKKILFPESGQVQALDNYFRLAKIIAENPNPSGTALTAASMASINGMFFAPGPTIAANAGAGALSAVMNSPKAVQLFTRGTTLMLGPGKASKAAMSLGIADVLKAAREAGVSATPATADDTDAARPVSPQGR